MFEITIKQTRTVTRKTRSEWTVVGQESIEGPNGEWKWGHKYGHTPQVENEIEEVVTRYEQRVDALDIQRVIAAVNAPADWQVKP